MPRTIPPPSFWHKHPMYVYRVWPIEFIGNQTPQTMNELMEEALVNARNLEWSGVFSEGPFVGNDGVICWNSDDTGYVVSSIRIRELESDDCRDEGASWIEPIDWDAMPERTKELWSRLREN